MFSIGYSGRTFAAFSLALFVHLILLVALLAGWSGSPKPRPVQRDSALIVQATVVSRGALLAKAKQQKERRQQASPEQSEKTEGKAVERQSQHKSADKQSKQETQRPQSLEQQRRQAQLKRSQVRKQAQAEAKRKQVEEEQRRAEAERQRRQAQRRQTETKRRAKEERRRTASARRRRERRLQARLEAAQNNAPQPLSKVALTRFINRMQRQVNRHWIHPPRTGGDLVVVLQVELLPSGKVRDVAVVQSSGSRAFDRSAQAAIYRAAPLPVPTDPAVAERLLPSFNFKFNPGG